MAVPVPLQDVDSSAFEKFPEKVHVPVRLRAGPLSGPVESPPPHPIIKRQSERAMLLLDTSNMYRAKEQPVGRGDCSNWEGWPRKGFQERPRLVHRVIH